MKYLSLLLVLVCSVAFAAEPTPYTQDECQEYCADVIIQNFETVIVINETASAVWYGLQSARQMEFDVQHLCDQFNALGETAEDVSSQFQVGCFVYDCARYADLPGFTFEKAATILTSSLGRAQLVLKELKEIENELRLTVEVRTNDKET